MRSATRASAWSVSLGFAVLVACTGRQDDVADADVSKPPLGGFACAPDLANARVWTFPGEIYPSDSDVADFDGDGRLDEVSAVLKVDRSGPVTITTDEVVITFDIWNERSTIEISGRAAGGIQPPQSVVVGDFNRDGRDDIVMADATSDGLYVLAGKSDRTFEALPVFAWRPSALITSGDVNGDGYPDVVGQATIPEVSLNQGDGTFGAAIYSSSTQYVRLSQDPVGAQIALAHIDDDDHLDLIATARVGAVGTVAIATMLGDGTGHFVSHHWYYSPGIDRMHVLDVDGDDRIDVVNATAYHAVLEVLRGSSDTTFGEWTTIAWPGPVLSSAFGDITGDARPDFVFEGDPDHDAIRTTYVMENIDGRLLGDAQNFGGDLGGVVVVAIRDIDGDGHNDLIGEGIVIRSECVERPPQ